MNTEILKIKAIIKIIICSIIGLLIFSGCNSRPDHFPYAERYRLKVKESDLINAAEIFKKENPEYAVPLDISEKVDGYDKNEPVYPWYRIYFYYPKENQFYLHGFDKMIHGIRQ